MDTVKADVIIMRTMKSEALTFDAAKARAIAEGKRVQVYGQESGDVFLLYSISAQGDYQEALIPRLKTSIEESMGEQFLALALSDRQDRGQYRNRFAVAVRTAGAVNAAREAL